ncbi:hypothetical protein PsYK624_092640 [Phanerochaete sordida]|uniref:Uncharacterized protein n=1 Tax=Phanerochaete sordida TaxID=48140 RepID=A0A9P3GG50_9APHY|nr:hypothetical protein PsYK624_092640 [Phanerochaete sordida]
MLQLPNGGGPTVDGIPVVDFPDLWEDVRDFLRMMYGALKIPPCRRAHNSVTAVAGALRLATKYDAPDMAQQLLYRLEYDYPNSFSTWTEVEDERRLLEPRTADWWDLNVKDPGPDPFFDINHCTPEPASAVRLAQDVRAGTLLRAAWYELARSYAQGSSLFKGPGSPFDWTDRRAADLTLLEAGDLRRLLVGRERLRDLAHNAMEALREHARFSTERSPCKNCQEQPEASLKMFMSTESYRDLAFDPLGGLLELRRAVEQSACDSCKYSVRTVIMDTCKEIWDTLVEAFELQKLGIEVPDDSVF